MKTGIEIHSLIRWEKSESFPPLQLHKEIVSSIIMSMSNNTSTSNPEIYLIVQKVETSTNSLPEHCPHSVSVHQ